MFSSKENTQDSSTCDAMRRSLEMTVHLSGYSISTTALRSAVAHSGSHGMTLAAIPVYAHRMRAVVQRVSRARVIVENQTVGDIGNGLLVLLGVSVSDSESDANYLVEKICTLRIFEDADGKMNLDVSQTGGAILAVSQFTLYGDVRRGRRPSFDDAARPERARQLYEYFVEQIRTRGLRCETGQFQATMQVELVNQGPVTILLDSQKQF